MKTACALVSIFFLVSACSTGGAVEPSGPTATTSTTGTTTEESTPDPNDLSTTTTADTQLPTTTTTTLPPTFESLQGIDTILDFADDTDQGISRWERSVPGIEDIRITSTADGVEQPALWLAPTGDRGRPLLVILHSWSSGYTQHAGIPYAMWAQENGWAVIAPQFRGVNDDADALGSDLAVQDVADAIDHAIAQDGVDSDRVYAVGYSGGGMMSLLMAGRHPDKVTAVAAWGPVYDLVDFYRQSLATGRHYAGNIRAGCGGDPTDGGSAQEECLSRSPLTYLDRARDQGVPVYIAQGIFDSLVSPRHGARAFNQLADPDDGFGAEEVDEIGRGILPDHLVGSITAETYLGEGDPEPVFSRRSGPITLVLFESGHDMAYRATLRWLASDPR